jgi:hypothetical protein
MSHYTKASFDDSHETHDHEDCGLKYIVHKLDQPILEFTGTALSGKVTYDANNDVFTVEGQFTNSHNVSMNYWAANPIPRMYSYSGSGLPFPNPSEAYENTPNQGQILLDNDGKFTFKLDHPAGYYVRQGKILMKAHVHLKTSSDETVYTVMIADYFPYRSLKNLPDRPNRSVNR